MIQLINTGIRDEEAVDEIRDKLRPELILGLALVNIENVPTLVQLANWRMPTSEPMSVTIAVTINVIETTNHHSESTETETFGMRLDVSQIAPKPSNTNQKRIAKSNQQTAKIKEIVNPSVLDVAGQAILAQIVGIPRITTAGHFEYPNGSKSSLSHHTLTTQQPPLAKPGNALTWPET